LTRAPQVDEGVQRFAIVRSVPTWRVRVDVRAFGAGDVERPSLSVILAADRRDTSQRWEPKVNGSSAPHPPSALNANFRSRQLGPFALEAFEGFAGGGELLGSGRRVMAGPFFEFERECEVLFGRGLHRFDGGLPIDGAVVGR
jgi:hypothetical protein